MMTDKEYQPTPISVNAAAKKYGIPQRTLANWTRRGLIKVLKYPENRGQKMLVDEASLVIAIQHYRPQWRWPRLPIYQISEPLPPFRYCPYCGQPLPGSKKQSPRNSSKK